MNTYKGKRFEQNKMREEEIIKIVKKIRKGIFKNRR